jgi:hypothetical protein
MVAQWLLDKTVGEEMGGFQPIRMAGHVRPRLGQKVIIPTQAMQEREVGRPE